jgi:hypothetical protein
MAAPSRLIVAASLAGLALPGCTSLPTPDYVDVRTPPSFRTQGDGARLDNASYKLDAQGYRVDDQGERLGVVDVPEATAGENSNAVAGYWISSVNKEAPGKVASTNDIVAPPESAPTPAQMPQQAPIAPAPNTLPPPPGYR